MRARAAGRTARCHEPRDRALASTVRVRAARGDARAGRRAGKALTGMPTLEPDELSSSESSSAATFAAIAAEPALRPRRCAKARALQQASPPLLDQRPSRTASRPARPKSLQTQLSRLLLPAALPLPAPPTLSPWFHRPSPLFQCGFPTENPAPFEPDRRLTP